MAHYVWNESVPLGGKLRKGLESLREARHLLIDVVRAMEQMDDKQVAAVFGFSDEAIASAAKQELIADVAKSDIGDASGQALQQMLDQFA